MDPPGGDCMKSGAHVVIQDSWVTNNKASSTGCRGGKGSFAYLLFKAHRSTSSRHVSTKGHKGVHQNLVSLQLCSSVFCFQFVCLFCFKKGGRKATVYSQSLSVLTAWPPQPQAYILPASSQRKIERVPFSGWVSQVATDPAWIT